MIRTSRQLKALVRNISKGDSAKAQIIKGSWCHEPVISIIEWRGDHTSPRLRFLLHHQEISDKEILRAFIKPKYVSIDRFQFSFTNETLQQSICLWHREVCQMSKCAA